MSNFYLPLMSDNIDKEDVNALIDFLSQDQIPKLTNGPKVVEFENKWGEWLGTKYNLMVNSGASANELTMLALNYIHDNGEIIIPPLTWISDISSVIFSGFKPVFCDINLKNELLQLCKEKNILLIEEVCESHGTTFKGQKVGSIGFASNFSFYFAHHMSTIEGGMICTNDEHFYQVCRALRSHGMTREITNEDFKHQIIEENPDLNPDFIFLHPAHNFRSTELNAVIGLSQIKKLDSNNIHRVNNFKYFMERLDSNKYHTDIELEGQCNYAFIVVLKENSFEKRNNVESTLKEKGIEFRRGLSGGGNQLRQPYFKKNYNINYDNFKNVDHIHNFSWYIGNYPTLEQEKIDTLINILNNDI